MTILWKSFVLDSGIRSDPFQPFNLLTLSLQSFPIPFIPLIPVIPITGRNDTLAAKEFWCVARRKTDGYL